jgi:cysteine sulfinate desulfinase/cysteine desulfurase-like protein
MSRSSHDSSFSTFISAVSFCSSHNSSLLSAFIFASVSFGYSSHFSLGRGRLHNSAFSDSSSIEFIRGGHFQFEKLLIKKNIAYYQMAEYFFDNNANYPISRETIECYGRGSKIGNVSCRTKLAEKGRLLIDEFVRYVGDEFSGTNDANKYKAIITSGGSESNSTVIHHYIYESIFLNGIRPHFICSTVEHPSITDYLIRIENDRIADISWVKPQSNGEVLIENIITAVRPNTVCVFLQSVNSETGCEQNIAALWKAIKHRRIRIHVDHVQGYRKIELPRGIADTLSISLHKVGAPLGIGVLIYRSSMEICPLIAGKQNDGLRGGTYNIGAIAAASNVLHTFEMKPMSHYKKYFLQQLSEVYDIRQYSPGMKFSGSPTIVLFSDNKCLPHTLFMSIHYVETLCGKAVKEMLFQDDFTIGTGTACANEAKVAETRGSMTSSDIDEHLKIGFLRISFNNTINQKILKNLSKSLNTIPATVDRVRS